MTDTAPVSYVDVAAVCTLDAHGTRVLHPHTLGVLIMRWFRARGVVIDLLRAASAAEAHDSWLWQRLVPDGHAGTALRVRPDPRTGTSVLRYTHDHVRADLTWTGDGELIAAVWSLGRGADGEPDAGAVAALARELAAAADATNLPALHRAGLVPGSDAAWDAIARLRLSRTRPPRGQSTPGGTP